MPPLHEDVVIFDVVAKPKGLNVNGKEKGVRIRACCVVSRLSLLLNALQETFHSSCNNQKTNFCVCENDSTSSKECRKAVHRSQKHTEKENKNSKLK